MKWQRVVFLIQDILRVPVHTQSCMKVIQNDLAVTVCTQNFMRGKQQENVSYSQDTKFCHRKITQESSEQELSALYDHLSIMSAYTHENI